LSVGCDDCLYARALILISLLIADTYQMKLLRIARGVSVKRRKEIQVLLAVQRRHFVVKRSLIPRRIFFCFTMMPMRCISLSFPFSCQHRSPSGLKCKEARTEIVKFLTVCWRRHDTEYVGQWVSREQCSSSHPPSRPPMPQPFQVV
jgi:hypothetical protein